MRSNGAITNGFILPNNEVAKNGTQHDDIAGEYLSNKGLWERYNSSKFKDLSDFMVFELGALKVGCNASSERKIITYCPDLLTKDQWDYVLFYRRLGYRCDEVDRPT